MSSGVAGMRKKMVRRWHWPAVRSTLESSCDWESSVAKWRPACNRNNDVGTGGRAQSLARLNLGHELVRTVEYWLHWCRLVLQSLYDSIGFPAPDVLKTRGFSTPFHSIIQSQFKALLPVDHSIAHNPTGTQEKKTHRVILYKLEAVEHRKPLPRQLILPNSYNCPNPTVSKNPS